MKTHWRTLLLTGICVALITSCTVLRASAVSVPTYTPYPTYTVLPTYTAVMTMTPLPTPTSHYRPITWDELNAFLAGDHTNWHPYNADTYNCVNFAMDLDAAASSHNIESWIVVVFFKGGGPGHTFVAFPTTDKGEVWIEPQSDYAYASVEVGKPLCLKINPERCEDWGIVSEVHEHATCNYSYRDCWW